MGLPVSQEPMFVLGNPEVVELDGHPDGDLTEGDADGLDGLVIGVVAGLDRLDGHRVVVPVEARNLHVAVDVFAGPILSVTRGDLDGLRLIVGLAGARELKLDGVVLFHNFNLFKFVLVHCELAYAFPLYKNRARLNFHREKLPRCRWTGEKS